MRYTLLLHYPEGDVSTLGEEAIQEGMRAFSAYAETLHAAGVLLSGEVLQPSASSTTVRRTNGRFRVQGGPFADAKEQLGGTFVIDVPDLDSALDWAKRAPSVDWGAVEVRPGATFVRNGLWEPNA